jgi:hypothetical protein
MDYTSCLTIELLSLFRWENSGWQSPVSLLTPDATLKLKAHEVCSGNRWDLDLSLGSIELHNDLVDEDLTERLVDAVIKRCKKDAKIIQIFGESLRKGAVIRSKAQSNMFYPTDFRVNFGYKYRFIVALDGTSEDKVDGVYLIPSYFPAPKDGLESDSIYKMCCYERM